MVAGGVEFGHFGEAIGIKAGEKDGGFHLRGGLLGVELVTLYSWQRLLQEIADESQRAVPQRAVPGTQ